MTKSDHKSKTMTGLAWSGIDRIVQAVLNFGVTVVLARLLVPEDFGLLAMVTVVTGFVTIFFDFGFTNVVIYKQDMSRLELDSIFWFNIATGLVLFAIAWLSADFIASFYANEKLVLITKVVSVAFILKALNVVQSALYLKRLQFKMLTLVSFSAIAVSSSFAIYLAFKGWNVWALVYRSLAQNGITVILLFIFSSWWPTLSFSFSALAGNFNYAAKVAGNNIITYWSRNFDNLIIGKISGEHTLGLYSKSYSLMMLPLQNISMVIRRVMLPSFAQIQNDKDRVRNIYLQLTNLICFFTFPFVVCLTVLAEPIILTVYGPKWAGMILPVQLLSLGAIPRAILSLNGSVFLAMGRPDIPLKINLILVPILLAGFYFGLTINGLLGLLIAYLVIWSIAFFPLFLLAARLIDLNLSTQVLNLRGIFLITILQMLVVYSIGELEILDRLSFLFLGTILIFGSSWAYAHWTHMKSYLQLRAFIEDKFKRK